MGSGCILLHFTLHFAAFHLAFWCILQCVLVQNALQHHAHRLHFLVVVDANLGEISFKEKCKSIVNGKKLREKHAIFAAFFITQAHFIWVFQGIFSRMVRPKNVFCKTCLPF